MRFNCTILQILISLQQWYHLMSNHGCNSHRCRWAGGQLKTWATTIKADLELIFGHARRRKDWVNVSSELAQDRRALRASVQDGVNSIGDAGSTRPRFVFCHASKWITSGIVQLWKLGIINQYFLQGYRIFAKIWPAMFVPSCELSSCGFR